MKTKLQHFFFIGLFLFSITGCIKKDFDEPPVDDITTLDANYSIKQLKDAHKTGGVEEITEDWVLRATVVADDESGNFYKTIIIQDATAGMELRLNFVGLYNRFPVGRVLYIKTKGLYVTDYEGSVQLSATPAGDGIEEVLIDNYIYRGEKEQFITPEQLGINELTMSNLHTLITLKDVEFEPASAGTTWADPVNKYSVNHTLVDCNRNDLLVRSSGYASFAGKLTPNGKGSITGILSVYRGSYQFFIRDLEDVSMDGTRCNGGGSGGGNALESLTEDFSSQSDYDDLAMQGWLNVASTGTRKWIAREFSSNLYAQASAYNDPSPNMETWLITPKLDLDKITSASFETATAYHTHDGLSVYISTDFDGTNVASANWQTLNATLANGISGDHTWVPSGNIDLSSYSGTGYIAFKYEGNSSSNTGTFRIDNIDIK